MRRAFRDFINRRIKDDRFDGKRELLSQIIAVWRLILLLVIFGISMAFFEGSSLGLLALAVSTVTSESGSLQLERFGELGAWLSSESKLIPREQLFLYMVLSAVLFQILRSLMSFIGHSTAIRLTMRVRQALEERATNHVMRFDYLEICRHRSGELAQKIASAGNIANLIQLIHTAVVATFLLLTYLFLMFLMSVPLTLISILVGLLVMLAMSTVIKKLRNLSTIAMEKSLLMSRYAIEFFNSARLIRIFSATNHAKSLINDNRGLAIKAQERQMVIKAMIAPFMEITTIVGAASFLIGGVVLLEGSLTETVATLFLFLLALYRAMPQLQTISSVRASLAASSAVIKVVGDLLRQEDKTFVRSSARMLRRFSEKITFENVWFRYRDDQEYVVRDLSFDIPKSTTVALVGTSGSGKSTIADLCLNLINPSQGRVLVDGVNLAEVNQKSWLDQVGAVEQDVFLLNDTIEKNISFGGSGITLEDVKVAAKVANADQFINELPEGYETVIGDRGLRISGGQRQRIAMARAFARKPELIVLDEATSALDSISEQAIRLTLESMHHQCTMLVIAHRLSTVSNADLILVLENGRIVERGSFEELVKIRGRFAELWRAQYFGADEGLSDEFE